MNNQFSSIKAKTQNWCETRNGVNYFYLYNYYPTNLEDFEATDDEWDVRNLVWNFKNDTSRISLERHEQALDTLVSEISIVLQRTFAGTLHDITLVCIPASSAQKTRDRYEEFSHRLCEKTGMQNAYPHIRVTRDATPKHLGGDGRPQLTIDKDYFRGRNVLLFDDVTTTGKSLERYQDIMNHQLCASTIGGLCIAKTKHERVDGNPIDKFKPSSEDIVKSLLSMLNRP